MANYPELSLSVEAVVFSYANKTIKVLLQLHDEKPFRDQWGLPFQLVKENESLEKTTDKIRQKLNKYSIASGIQSSIYSHPKRHPKTRLVSISMIFFAKPHTMEIAAPSYRWFDLNELPSLIMDHSLQIKDALKFLQTFTQNHTWVYDLLPDRFTLTQLQECFETIYGKPYDKRNFRKKIMSYGFIKPSREKQKGVAHKAATLYFADKKKLEKFQAL
ncbi:MAG: hypothetical protein N2167_00760 [Flavobacteriales bacterium]|nr:hypothetical protein [Flavobacteriales bacterium]